MKVNEEGGYLYKMLMLMSLFGALTLGFGG